MSKFQVIFNGTRVDAALIRFDSISQFWIILPNEDANKMITKLPLRGVAVGVNIITPSY